MEELLKHPQTLRILFALATHGPMNQRSFEFYAKISPTNGRQLRDWLEESGLILVDEEPERRTTRAISISITKEGEELLRLARQIERLLEQSKKNRGASRRSSK